MFVGHRPLLLLLLLLVVLFTVPARAEHGMRGPNGEPSISEKAAELRKEFVKKFNSAPTVSLKEKYSNLIQKLDCDEGGRDVYDQVLAETKNKKEARETEFMAVMQCYR